MGKIIIPTIQKSVLSLTALLKENLSCLGSIDTLTCESGQILRVEVCKNLKSVPDKLLEF